MEVGIVYSREDPRQKAARDFVFQYIKERGILAKVVEMDKPVKSPTLIINGEEFKEMRSRPRRSGAPMFPGIRDLARVLEKHSWCL